MLAFKTSAQDKLIGHYYNNFGGEIYINPDSTFKYTWHFDLSSSWTKGTWTTSRDTIYFKMIPIYDTLVNETKSANNGDSVVLSGDEISARISIQDFAMQSIVNGGQNEIVAYPRKLFYKENKLFELKNEKINRKKVKGFGTAEKYDPWYIKK